MPVPATLTKATSQTTPYFWMWATRGTRSTAGKRIGSSIFYVEGADDTECLQRVNGHEGWRAADNRPIHG